LPAPITIVVGHPSAWWTNPGLEKFDYVLVQGWQPSATELAAVPARWQPAGRSGLWSLWRRPP
jgi:hypothetical protein